MTGSAPTLLRVSAVSKTFPGLRALDDVSLELASGEILAVVGQNGSGKSTLVKILTGVHDADPGGTVEIRGQQEAAAQQEMHVIHQDLGLVHTLSAVENFDLGRVLGRRGLLPAPRREEQRRAREQIARFGADFDVELPVGRLSPAERSIVALARALDGWERPDQVLILDEPTAALQGEEVGRLFTAIKHVAAEGAGVIFISHRLDEVMELADRVLALRDGRVVADVAAGGFDHDALVGMIAGRELKPHVSTRAASEREPVLRVRDLAGATVRGVDFDARPGEILGVSGILGSGREHLAGLIFGALPRRSGEVIVAGAPLAAGRPYQAIRDDVGFVPGDRAAEGAIMRMAARENLTLPRLGPLKRALGRLDGRAERREVGEWVARIGLAPAEPERPLELFSGGNQQKVVLAKWLRIDPKVLLLDEPTQGVDVGAKALIYELIESAAHAGSAIVVSSSDEKELALLCDRVIVMRDGRVAAELHRASLTEAQLVLEGLGLRDEEAEALFGETAEAGHA